MELILPIMAFCSYSKDAALNAKTSVDNSFLTRYMPSADALSLKVYLLGLSYCESKEEETIESMAELLSVTNEDIKNAFLFWEDFGLVDIISENPFTVRYLSASDAKRRPRPEKYTGFNSALQAIFPEREISVSEYGQYMQFLEEHPISQEALLMIIGYCKEYTGNENLRFNYVKTTALNFIARGIHTVSQVEKELSSYTSENESVRKLYSAMGLKKRPELSDGDYLAEWRKLEFEFENILFVAKKLKRGSMEKLNATIKELYADKCFSREEIDYYLSRKDALLQKTYVIAKKLGVYLSYAETYMEKFVSPWSSLGYTDEALDAIADFAFATRRRSFEEMDDLLRAWYDQGVVSVESIAEHLARINKSEAFVKQILQKCSLSRRVTEADLSTVRTWQNWGFSDEMILRAADEAIGKANPIPYMTAVLSSWKTKHYASPSDIPTRAQEQTIPAQRTTSKEELDALVAEASKRYRT